MNLLTTLLEHQQPAVQKMLPTRVGALFMDMGTGKTRVAIELAARRLALIDRVLIFCPVSLKETWRHEIAKHTDAGPADIYLFDDRTSQRALPAAFWCVAGIESMSASNRMVLAANALITERTFVIVDESSYIKGHKAKRTERITAMSERARYRLLLTGTPLSQGVVDLYAQMRFLSPAILGYSSFYSFAANHLEFSDKFPGLIVRAHRVDHLAAKIQPYVYQVTKDECLDLPRKLYDLRYYGMTAEQRSQYEYAKAYFLDVEEITSYDLFRLFTSLQQIISGYWRHPDTGEVIELPHYRLDMLSDTLASIPDGAKVIVWCKYHYSLRQIVAMLSTAHGPEAVAQFHGDLSEQARNAELARFRAGARFLVATQSAGGHGLTLNEAHHAVFYENGFKYAERAQAEDRCHRIGQARPVTYLDLVCRRSIDERIQRALADKADVVEAFRRQVQQVKDKKDKAGIKAIIQEL